MSRKQTPEQRLRALRRKMKWRPDSRKVIRHPAADRFTGTKVLPDRFFAMRKLAVKHESAVAEGHAPLEANGINGDLRWFPTDVSMSHLDGSISDPKATLTAVLGKELHRFCFEVSAAGIYVANADGLASGIDDLRLSKEATASQQDDQKRDSG
jgi:hypothetical protein